VDSEVVVKDIPVESNGKKTSEEVVRENDEFVKQLGINKLSQESNVNDDITQEIIDKRSGNAELPDTPIVKEEAVPMTANVTSKKHVSLKLGIVGSGQAGGRIAEVYSRYGYEVCAINTAQQDLEFLNMPKESKFLIKNELGGTGKDLDVSAQYFEAEEDNIRQFIEDRVGECDVLMLVASGAGGSGSGSAELLSTWMYEMGKPVIVTFVLPGSFDDTQGKHNAVVTLGKLSDMCSKGIVNSILLVDNLAIEAAYPDLSPSKFWDAANEAAVEPLHMFNKLSVTPTSYESFDDMDFAKSLLEANGFCVMGSNTVSKDWYEDDETALMEAIIEGLENGLLARGFNLKEAQTVGVIVTARESVLESIPYSSISYMFKYISDEFDSAKAFRGIYAVPGDSDDIQIHFMFSGLGRPESRVESLKAESEKHLKILKDKKANTKITTSSSNDGSDEVARKIERIKKRKTGVGKLLNPKKPVRRRR